MCYTSFRFGMAGLAQALASRTLTSAWPCRTFMYVPTSDERKVTKAVSGALGADSIVLDLEDGVATTAKDAARANVLSVLSTSGAKTDVWSQSGKNLLVRVNDVRTELGMEDLNSLSQVLESPSCPVSGIVIPMVDDVDQLSHTLDVLNRGGVSRSLHLIAMIETAMSVVNLPKFVHEAPKGLAGLVFGAEDYCRDAGITRTGDGSSLAYARAAIANAARAGRYTAIDMVCTSLKGPNASDQLESEVKSGAGMGYHGKQVIHPMQVAPVAAGFSPNPTKVSDARELLAAAADAESQGQGAFVFRGSMVDMPVIRAAQDVVEIAELWGL